MDAETQAEEFDYLLNAGPSEYRAPDKEFFHTDEKIRFYTGLPSREILMVAFEHVVKYITHRTQSLNRFQEFVMVLMKLRLNVPVQDLQPRTKLLRHFNAIFNVAPCNHRVQKEQTRPPSPPLVQCCFGLTAQACISCVTANNIAMGGGGKQSFDLRK